MALGRKRTLVRDFVQKQVNWGYQPFSRMIPPETFRYALTGGLNVGLDIFLYFVFYNFILHKHEVTLGNVTISPYIAAFLFVFPITFSTGFMLARHITFTGSMIRGRVQLLRYSFSVGGSIVLNYLLLKLFVEYFGFWPTISKIIVTVFVVTYSYLIQKHFTFKTGSVHSSFLPKK